MAEIHEVRTLVGNALDALRVIGEETLAKTQHELRAGAAAAREKAELETALLPLRAEVATLRGAVAEAELRLEKARTAYAAVRETTEALKRLVG